MFVRLLNANRVHIAHKGVLLRRSGMVCNLYPSLLLHGIMVKIDIRSLIKAVVRGFRCGRAEEVVNVSKERQ